MRTGAGVIADKFLLVGRGVGFRRACAAVHPAPIVRVLPPMSVKSAAVRDSSLHSALKLASHRVDVVEQPANLADALGRSRHDIVLVERADASAAGEAAASTAQTRPSVVSVVEDGSGFG